jgi:hypothetical protein
VKEQGQKSGISEPQKGLSKESFIKVVELVVKKCDDMGIDHIMGLFTIDH